MGQSLKKVSEYLECDQVEIHEEIVDKPKEEKPSLKTLSKNQVMQDPDKQFTSKNSKFQKKASAQELPQNVHENKSNNEIQSNSNIQIQESASIQGNTVNTDNQTLGMSMQTTQQTNNLKANNNLNNKKQNIKTYGIDFQQPEKTIQNQDFQDSQSVENPLEQSIDNSILHTNKNNESIANFIDDNPESSNNRQNQSKFDLGNVKIVNDDDNEIQSGNLEINNNNNFENTNNDDDVIAFSDQESNSKRIENNENNQNQQEQQEQNDELQIDNNNENNENEIDDFDIVEIDASDNQQQQQQQQQQNQDFDLASKLEQKKQNRRDRLKKNNFSLQTEQPNQQDIQQKQEPQQFATQLDENNDNQNQLNLNNFVNNDDNFIDEEDF